MSSLSKNVRYVGSASGHSFGSLLSGNVQRHANYLKERKPLYPKRHEFLSKLSGITSVTGLNIPEQLYCALFYCIISKGHLLVNISNLGQDGIHTGIVLQQMVPFLVGMKCTYLSCSKLTTLEILLEKMISAQTSETHKSDASSVFRAASSSIRKAVNDEQDLGGIYTSSALPLSTTTSNVTIPLQTQTPKVSIGPHRGPQISQVIIIENLESAPISTQHALFEVMETQKLLLYGRRYSTSELFTVIVITSGNLDETQNINPLSEKMYDSFLVSVDLSKPLVFQISKEDAHPAYTPKELVSLRAAVPTIYLNKDVEQYMRNIIFSLRHNSEVTSAISPKATSSLEQVVRVVALLNGQIFVTPSHVLSIAGSVLCHRITLKTNQSIMDFFNHILNLEIPPV